MTAIILWVFFSSSALQPEIKNGPLGSFSWLTGSWHIPGTESQYYENWEVINDSLMQGTGWVTAGSDTVFFESIELRYLAGAIDYIVHSREENEGQSVAFRLTSDSADTYVFENPSHDFPQRIVYRHPTPDSLSAYIEGTVNGTFRRSDFPMVRKQ